jgi:CubicO group peptidase (beta-lactamase class C family)
MRIMAALAGAVALAAWGGGAQAQPAALDALFTDVTPGTPGCAVGVKAKDGPPVLRGYGSADLEHAVPVTADTIFEAGSVSKQFTAAAILLLVEDGKLSLSDDIRKHLPEMPDYGRPITVDMLLSHTSGLRDWGEVMALAGWPRTSRVYTPLEVVQIAARQKALNYAPGEAYSYTNTGYNLAAAIVMRVSGYRLADFTRLRIFEPLGMRHTSWRDRYRRIVPGRAVAYTMDDGELVQEMPFENTYGHGGLLTTVGDLLIWNDALSAGRLGGTVSARLQEQAVLTSGRKIAYARGLVVQAWRGQAEIAHSGATAGYRAWLARFPAEKLSVALLCNGGSTVNPVRLGHRIADLYLPAGPAAPGPAAQLPEDLAALPGVYVDERTGQVLKVTAEKDALVAGAAGPLSPTGKGRYRAGDTEFRFGVDAFERRTGDGEAVRFRRTTPWTPTAADLAGLAGAYSSFEAGGVLQVAARNGALVIAPADRTSAPRIARPLEKDTFQTDDGLLRALRDRDGRVTGLKFTTPRVYALEFRRIDGS